jgi:small nuclear ribonucleoprotein G
LEKTIQLQLNKGRKVQGTLLGYDQFMNVVLSNAVEEEKSTGRANSIGMVAIRGNSILQLELVG